MKRSDVLVVGGGGYIGSHMLIALQIQDRYNIVVIDNLSTGFEELVSHGVLYRGDILDSIFLDEVFSKHNFDVVFHFAAFSQVGESTSDPAKYYRN